MNFAREISLVLAVVAVIGCESVRNAREAQDDVSSRAAVDAPIEIVSPVKIAGKSLEELVTMALTNRPSLVSSRLAVEDARLSLKSLYSEAPLVSTTPWTSPKLSVAGGYDASSVPSHFKNRDFETFGDPSASLSLSLLVYDFGRHSAKVDAECENVLAAEEALVNDGYAVFIDVANAYFDFLQKKAILDVARTNEFEYADYLELAEGLVAAGEAKRLDVLRARLNLATAKEKTVVASNAVLCAAVELTRALGYEAGPIGAEEFIRLGAEPIHRLRRAFDPSTAGYEELYSFARTNAPTMRIARAELRAKKAMVDAAIADLLPEITASTSLAWSNPLWVWNWGVGATEMLFQGFRKTTAIDRAVVAMRKAAANVDTLEQSLSSDITSALFVRDNAREAQRTARDALLQAKENLETVREEYKVGVASRIDYSAAVSAYVTELGTHVKAFYAGEMAEAAIIRLIGVKPIFNESIVEGVR